MFCFQLSRYGTHRGNGCGNILFQHRIMLFNHIYKCWTAGSCLLLALLIRFHPLCCFCIGGHICTQCHFYQIGKSDLLQGFSPAGNGNTIPKLPFCTRGNHCNDPLSSNQCLYDIYQKRLGTNRSEWAAMNTVPALNAFALVNLTDTIFIHRHCIHRTASLTWSNQVCNRIVWTGFRTFSAFFTERGVNMCPCPSNINRTESAGLLT